MSKERQEEFDDAYNKMTPAERKRVDNACDNRRELMAVLGGVGLSIAASKLAKLVSGDWS